MRLKSLSQLLITAFHSNDFSRNSKSVNHFRKYFSPASDAAHNSECSDLAHVLASLLLFNAEEERMKVGFLQP